MPERNEVEIWADWSAFEHPTRIGTLNPMATGDGLALAISETDNAQDLELVRSVADRFRVTRERAKELENDVVRAVRQWRREATRAGIPRAEQERMSGAFRLVG